MIYKRLSFNDFEQEFKNHNRENQFPTGLRELYEYITEAYGNCEEGYELDVIELCCEFQEDTLKNILKEYNLESLDELHEHTLALELDEDTVLIEAF
jgi:hypothetical protein